MRLPFVKKKSGDDLHLDNEHHVGDYSPAQVQDGEKGSNIFVRIALYGGVLIVFAIAAGGYYYLNFTRMSLNKSVSNDPPAVMKAINLGGGQDNASSREAQFIQVPSNEAKQLREPSTSNAPVSSPSSAPGDSDAALPVPVKPDAKTFEKDVPPKTLSPLSGERTARNAGKVSSSASPDEPGSFLSQLVLREDNPFRERFIKRFQDSRTSGKLQKDGRLAVDPGKSSLYSRTGKRERVVQGPAEGELGILPAIAGGKHDLPGGLKVFGVIRTQEDSTALTSRGELKVGSVVDGDAVTGIVMSEVRFKSGRTFKVSAQ